MGCCQGEQPDEPAFEGQRLERMRPDHHRYTLLLSNRSKAHAAASAVVHGLATHCSVGQSAGVIIDRPKHTRTHNRTRSTGFGNVVSTNAETTGTKTAEGPAAARAEDPDRAN